MLGFVALLATRFSMFERGVAELRRQGQPVEFADLRLDDDSQTDARVFLVQTDGARDAMLAALESSDRIGFAGFQCRQHRVAGPVGLNQENACIGL